MSGSIVTGGIMSGGILTGGIMSGYHQRTGRLAGGEHLT